MNVDTFNFEINSGSLNDVQIKFEYGYYFLNIKNIKWMLYDTKTRCQAKEVIAHYDLAYGNVITTGLGLGIREQMLLTKPEVSSLTVLERSSDLIDFHKKYSKWINNPKLTIVNINANDYRGECDVLLLDHYEAHNLTAVLNNVSSLIKKINCKAFWFWPLEMYLLEGNLPLIEKYNAVRNALDKLPALSEKQLEMYCSPFVGQLKTI